MHATYANVKFGISSHRLFLLAMALATAVSPAMAQDSQLENKRQIKATDSLTSTLGLTPPAGAEVLFDGSSFDAWKPFSFQVINPKNDQKEIQWKLVDGESMQIAFEHKGKKRKQFICTKKRFGDYRLHLEFQLPKDGGKGNSGLFFGPLYELQILDSGNKEKAGLNDCGAIYQIRVPDENAALGPGQWQTVDLEYRAARFGAHGSMTEKNAARVTIRLNGKLIHDDFKLSLRRNKYGAFPEEPTSPIVLQEHGSPVKFRNIWVVEKTPKKNVQKERPQQLGEKVHHVRSADDISDLVESGSVAPGDVIVWSDGEYTDQEIELNGLDGKPQRPITLRAETAGGVIFQGESQIRTNAKWWAIEGFHFKGGPNQTNAYNPVQFRGSGNIGAEHVRLTNCAFTNLDNGESSSKWIQVYGRFNRIDHCHFSGKPNKGALVTVELGGLKENETAEHLIEWNHFSDVAHNEGSDNETIRVGYSGDQNKSAKCVVRHNLFERCNGENEVVSNKSSFNTYSANTFRACNGSLVLRHGHHATVEGNYFLGHGAADAGGIRINDSHHKIFNNYMQDLTGLTWNAAISIEGGTKASGGDSNGYQAVDGLVIAHNSIINCAKSIFLNDKHGKRSPTGVIANNIIVAHNNEQKLIDARLSIEELRWESNLFSAPGKIPERIGHLESEPNLVEADGRYAPGKSSPAIDAASDGFEFVKFDIERRKRPASGKDIGAQELSDLPAALLRTLPLNPHQVGVTFLKEDE